VSTIGDEVDPIQTAIENKQELESVVSDIDNHSDKSNEGLILNFLNSIDIDNPSPPTLQSLQSIAFNVLSDDSSVSRPRTSLSHLEIDVNNIHNDKDQIYQHNLIHNYDTLFSPNSNASLSTEDSTWTLLDSEELSSPMPQYNNHQQYHQYNVKTLGKLFKYQTITQSTSHTKHTRQSVISSTPSPDLLFPINENYFISGNKDIDNKNDNN
jgi:hypothetical protein